MVDAIGTTADEEDTATAKDKALVSKILKRIHSDIEHHRPAHKQMRADMALARTGRVPGWPEDAYTANIVGRHIRMKVSALYAKNPKVVAQRRDTLDFAVWDENPDSLKLAYSTIQAAQAAPPVMMPDGQMMAPPQDPALALAQQTLSDFQAGMQRREIAAKTGRTAEVLFAYFMREQQPVAFKASMKKLVRRATTTGVGYIELGFERENGAPPEIVRKMADDKARLAQMQSLARDNADGLLDSDSAEIAALERSIAALEAQPEIVMREGLVFSFPRATKVYPDQACKDLTGFEGARHLTIEYAYSRQEVEDDFGIRIAGSSGRDGGHGRILAGTGQNIRDDRGDNSDGEKSDGGVRVYKHYDKTAGLVYYVADEHDGFLREPAAPDVFVEEFWPVFALTFNETESEDDLFPPSDVALLFSMQDEYNRSRQGQRDHRTAAKPRWVYNKGSLAEEDEVALASAPPFSVTPLNLGPDKKITDILAAMPVPGVDPNLYSTSQIFTDVQLVGGSQEANYGGVAQATATESTIAAGSTAASDSTAVDDLDEFLTTVARAGGIIMLKEMSAEQARAIAGPGATWPDETTLSDLADELVMEIEAGSSGRPNQVVELNNWQKLLPLLLQMPGISPDWVAKQTIKRMDDKADLTEAVAAGIPSIVLQNSAQQPGPQDPNAAPGAQGPAGANNNPAGPPTAQPGSDPAFGSNQV